MNLLTSKCKEAFESWLQSGDNNPWLSFFYTLPETVQLAYYQQFFDSVEIYIETDITPISWGFNICVGPYMKTFESMSGYQSRFESLIFATQKCNDIFNSKQI